MQGPGIYYGFRKKQTIPENFYFLDNRNSRNDYGLGVSIFFSKEFGRISLRSGVDLAIGLRDLFYTTNYGYDDGERIKQNVNSLNFSFGLSYTILNFSK
ncbi:MAG: hypothetical protein H7321_07245 [Bacteroidia bacterium]|nr:hypothetical protein [Bacteroidia bacterium]